MEKVSKPVDRHCRSKRTAKRTPAETENLASRLPYSTEPGIGEQVERFLLAVFGRLADHGAPLLDEAPGPTHFWG
jgi:hypothetical protein